MQPVAGFLPVQQPDFETLPANLRVAVMIITGLCRCLDLCDMGMLHHVYSPLDGNSSIPDARDEVLHEL